MNSIRVNFSEMNAAEQALSLTFFAVERLEEVSIPAGFFQKYAKLRNEIDDFFSFPGIQEIIHSREGNISSLYNNFFCLLFQKKDAAEVAGFLFGVHQKTGLALLGVFPLSFVRNHEDIPGDVTRYLEDLLVHPGEYENVNVVATI